MKTFRQVREIFDIARRFHEQLGHLYQRCSEQTERKRARLLLDYLSRHEENLSVCLARFEERVAPVVLDTWFQYVPDGIPLRDLETLELQPHMTIKEATALAMRMDDILIGFYRELAGNAETREARELFQSLLEMETNEEILLQREALTMQ
ncbi:MAG: hypothetical protein JW820_08730 [Spirochaetales bacterium]|nr:hypothetical protein [Spirochaetales bacterium]